MTDRLEELLVRQEPEGDEPVWWKDGRRRLLPGRSVEVPEENARKSREEPDAEEYMRRPETEQREKKVRAPAEELLQAQTQGWTAWELERVRRIARRVVQVSTGRETVHRNGHGAELFSGGSASVALKDSPAAGRQGLTAQIDMQFRRDARRYDGRLGLL